MDKVREQTENELRAVSNEIDGTAGNPFDSRKSNPDWDKTASDPKLWDKFERTAPPYRGGDMYEHVQKLAKHYEALTGEDFPGTDGMWEDMENYARAQVKNAGKKQPRGSSGSDMPAGKTVRDMKRKQGTKLGREHYPEEN